MKPGMTSMRGRKCEIEWHLSRLDGVADCAITVARAHNGTRRLVANVVLESTMAKENRDTVAAELKAALGRSLPPEWIPAEFLFAKSIATSARGKLERVRSEAP